MRKKTIAFLFIPGIILTIVGAVMWFSGVAAANVIISAASTTPQQAHDAAVAALFAPLPIALFAIGALLWIVSWIGTLVATGRQGRWGWFITVFLLSWLGQLIYLFAGPGLPAKAAAPAVQG